MKSGIVPVAIDITWIFSGQKDCWEHLEKALLVEDLMSEPWLGPDSHMGDLAMEQRVTSKVPGANCRYRLDSVLAIQIATRQGSGVAVLPCYLGDADSQLCRLTGPLHELQTQLWMLTHQDLRRVTRIQTLIREIGDRLGLSFVATPIRQTGGVG